MLAFALARTFPPMGQARETVTIQHEAAKRPREARISKRVRVAIDAMVFEGLKRADAAEKAGITDNALYIALRKPDVLAYLNTQQGVLRTSARARSIARIDNLADTSDSDHVKLDANKYLLGIEGVSVVQKSESVSIHKHLLPGLTIITGGWAPHGDDPRVIEGQAREVGSTHKINRIGQSVPHPLSGNVGQVANPPGISEGRSRAGRGEK